ncbi:type VII secretion protein EccB [Nocardioides hwasunensis]|uniref:Type VII secretion protein EccB n=1 Tax=Nocardioides hwasunensis TaxID=397258 RepID=A0ABR8MQJ4_9ACTN|nr:type VII secretion protein EccB [Nocardioides hwasunensis]MBD3917100.1 type VII secretion protein EccB [Nocardioides hwasunensis]
MATKKDLVEAHAFSRRRLVTAFVSGAPGGREVEPVRPGRVLIGGVALSVLLLAGAAIAGFLLGRPPAQWLDEGSFVISKDTGEQYVVLRGGDDPRLQRVPNYVSAQLLLGKADLTPFTVRDKYIRTVQLGEDLGIDRAPASLPSADELVDDGWSACTGSGVGIKVAVQRSPTVEDLTGSAFLVSSDDTTWLIATAPPVGSIQGRAYRYQMPADETSASTIGDRLGFGASPIEVDRDWLNLFPQGDALESAAFGIADAGQPVPYGDSGTDLSRYRIGDLLLSSTGRYYLLGDDKPEQLDPFAGVVYDVVGAPAIELQENLVATFGDHEYPEEWPAALPAPVSSGALCGVLHPGRSAAPAVSLATNPTGAADPANVTAGSHAVEVEPSAGAYVLSGGDDAASGGTPYVIDPKGEKYSLIGPQVPVYIGYGEVEPPQVPSSWLEFFQSGVPLSTNSARRVPEDAPEPADPEPGAEASAG